MVKELRISSHHTFHYITAHQKFVLKCWLREEEKTNLGAFFASINMLQLSPMLKSEDPLRGRGGATGEETELGDGVVAAAATAAS